MCRIWKPLEKTCLHTAHTASGVLTTDLPAVVAVAEVVPATATVIGVVIGGRKKERRSAVTLVVRTRDGEGRRAAANIRNPRRPLIKNTLKRRELSSSETIIHQTIIYN
jgi:hypothetical protein